MTVKWAIVEPFRYEDGDFDVAVIRHGFENIKDAEKAREWLLNADQTADPQNLQVIQYQL